MIHLTEDILHFAWKNALFDQDDLMTTNGIPLQFISRGKINRSSGPDFSNATIKIGNTKWVGNVEIHIHSSDWYTHKHQNDSSYDNVILHVVYFHDKEVSVKNQYLPVFELKNRIPPSLFRKYKTLLKREDDLACKRQINEIKNTTIIQQIEISLRTRLERKSKEIIEMHKKNNNDWEETSFQLLLLAFLGKINHQPALWLMEILNMRIIRSVAHDKLKLEALFIGMGGWLKEVNNEDVYAVRLKNEFEFLKIKYNLEELNPAIWKTGRIRPAQFPLFRLSQFASLLFQNKYLFSQFIEKEIHLLVKVFSNIESNKYWKNHSQLSKEMSLRSVKMGKMTQHILIINVVVPLLYAYGDYLKIDSYKNKSEQLLKKVKAEENAILKSWEELGVKPSTAFESQGLIEVYNNLCIQKKCLSCNIGMQIIKS